MTVRNDWITYAEHLIGTCKIPDEHDSLTDDLEFCNVLDGIAFKCTECGWWCEISEEASEYFGIEEWTCIECCES